VFRHDIDGDQILTANQSAEDTLQPQILVAFPQRNVELAQIPYRKSHLRTAPAFGWWLLRDALLSLLARN
jgi:hypothetical protein